MLKRSGRTMLDGAVAAPSSGASERQLRGDRRPATRGKLARLGFAVSVVVLVAALGFGFVSTLSDEAVAEAGAGGNGVPPVEATYHGVKPYDTISVGTLQYDAWTYGDIVFYSPPGKVTQAMANQWLAWYATTDDILRTLINDDEHFESRFRRNDRNFGTAKVIGTPTDSCGAGCGNKTQAEGVGIIDNMVADPDNYEHHWILFYEQARGGVDESFDLAASWPREAYHLPHLVAAFTFYEIDGLDGARRGVPGDIYGGLAKWEDLNRQYVDQFVEREQRWFDDPYPDGSAIYPPQTSMLLHIGLDNGYDTLAQVLRNVGQYPDNFMYENSTDAICDWQAAVNDATGNRYAERMVNDWGLPANCTYDMGPSGDHPNDLQFDVNGFCIEPNYKPNAVLLGHVPCDGSADQQYSIVNDRGDGTFSVGLGPNGRCLDASGLRLVTWDCHGAANQMWQWNGDRLERPGTGLCITATVGTRWGGGLVRLEPCDDSPNQRINTGNPEIVEPPESTTTTTAPSTSTTAAPTTTVAPTTTTPDRPTTTTTVRQTTTTTTATGFPDGEFTLMNLGSQKCLDQPWSQENLGIVIQWTCHGAANQLLQADPQNNGVRLIFSHSDKCLDMSNRDFYQYTCNGGDNQLFNWDGAQLRLRDSGQCLTIENDSLENRANVHLAPCTNRPSQQYQAQPHGTLLHHW